LSLWSAVQGSETATILDRRRSIWSSCGIAVFHDSWVSSPVIFSNGRKAKLATEEMGKTEDGKPQFGFPALAG